MIVGAGVVEDEPIAAVTGNGGAEVIGEAVEVAITGGRGAAEATNGIVLATDFFMPNFLGLGLYL